MCAYPIKFGSILRYRLKPHEHTKWFRSLPMRCRWCALQQNGVFLLLFQEDLVRQVLTFKYLSVPDVMGKKVNFSMSREEDLQIVKEKLWKYSKSISLVTERDDLAVRMKPMFVHYTGRKAGREGFRNEFIKALIQRENNKYVIRNLASRIHCLIRTLVGESKGKSESQREPQILCAKFHYNSAPRVNIINAVRNRVT